MSVEAISWAFQQCVPHSSAKFVLVAMANHADADMRCWPSAAHLCSQTAQDRKTVQANLARLREWGYLVDTGERRGTTKQVIVYQLNTPKNGPVSAATDEQVVGENTTENGPVKQAQKRNSSENGTDPNFPAKRPVFPAKEAQISPETGPKTGHGTIRNHQGTIKEPKAERAPKGTRLPADWKPTAADLDYCRSQRPDLDPARVEENFRDYWHAKPGKDACKLDWSATWRTWVRGERRVYGNANSAASDKFRVAHLDHSSSRAAMEASMKKHGITVPDGDIEF